MILINEEQIENAGSYDIWIDQMEMALLEDPTRDYIMPLRTHLNFRENTLLLMPVVKDNYISTKLVTLFPGNREKGKQPLFGIVVLNDGSTGEPLAILDGPKLTAMRTAAVGSVAIRHLAPPDVSSLGIIGPGMQGIHQALFACSQRNFSKIYILDSNTESYKRFIDIVSTAYPGIQIIIAENSLHLCSESEVIITATNSKTPVLPNSRELIRGKTIIGVGSYKPDMREFPDQLYTLVDKMLVDTLHGLKESGDLKFPLEKSLLRQEDFITIDKVISGAAQRSETNVFKSVGMALFDLFAARLVYESL